MSDSTIGNDVLDMDDGANAFLANLTGEEPKRQTSTTTDDKGTDEARTETREETEKTSEADDAATEGQEPEGEGEDAEIDPEDQEFEIKVGDQTVKQTLKELKRLAGQEAALTQKSQKLAESQKQSDARFQLATTGLTKMLSKAEEAYAPYAALDWMSLTAQVGAGQMTAEDFAALRQDAAAAEGQVKFIKEELGGIMQAENAKTAQAYQEAAKACIEALTDAKTGIPDFGKPMYDEMNEFVVKHGVPKNDFVAITNPAVIKIVHMAMQWQKAEAARKEAEGKVNSAPNKPTKVLRPGASKGPSKGQSQEAMAKLRRSGSVDDATDAFLASMK